VADRPRIKTSHPGVYYREQAGKRQYIIWYRGTDGRERFENVPGGERDAVLARAKILDRMAHGHRVAPTKVKLDVYAKRWLESYSPQAARTKELAEWAVEKHIIRLLGQHRVTELDVSKVAWYIAELQREGKKAWTIRATMTPLRHILKSAVRDGLLPTNPMDLLERNERPKGDQRKMEILDSDEIGIFLNAATEWYKPLLATAIFTGMRISEICNLRWDDVDWDEGILTVRKSKTRAGEREIVLMPELQQILARHSLEHEGSEFVFETHEGQQMKRRTVLRRAMEDTLRRSGIQKKLRFHDLRHTHAAMLIDQGHPDSFIAEQMGHTSISTTHRIYGHLIDRDKKRAEARAKMSSAFGQVLGQAGPSEHVGLVRDPRQAGN
jgi:integrase